MKWRIDTFPDSAKHAEVPWTPNLTWPAEDNSLSQEWECSEKISDLLNKAY